MIDAETSAPERLRRPKQAYEASNAPSRRQTASTPRLLLDALGGPEAWAGKLTRVARTVHTVLDRSEMRQRLDRLRGAGLLDDEPTALQLVLLGADMLRYFIEVGARDYYVTRGIDFNLHQILRVLDDPCSMIDPIGLLSDRDTIIGHVLQVVHANPVYDLQLLAMFEDGLAEMESQTAAMIDGTHPRARTIGAIVEDPEYHQRLLAYVRRYRADPSTPEPRRRAGRVREDRAFVLAEETFGAMPSAFRYACRLPRDVPSAIRHLRTRPTIDPRYCDPDVVAAVDAAFAG